MWADNHSDGCIYDTVDCDHSCNNCDYGIKVCSRCGGSIYYPDNECACKEAAILMIIEQPYFLGIKP